MRNNLMILQKPEWYFGDESNGILDTTTNITYPSTLDGPTIYRHYSSIRINAGHTVTTSNRCKGLVIYCTGDCVIDGILSMSDRGASAVGQLFNPNNINNLLSDNLAKLNRSIASVGGNGAIARSLGSAGGSDRYLAGANGSAGINGACGGGGSGGLKTHNSGTNTSGTGGNGTSWSGGAGSGGAGSSCASANSSDASDSGGAGSNGSSNRSGPCVQGGSGGGGAGNGGGGTSQTSSVIVAPTAGSSGTGGLILLIVGGNLIITGIIRSHGSSGGNGDGAGGGSGGGSITILYKGSYQNSGTISANGGVGGYGAKGSANGGAGGAGSIRIDKLFDNMFGVNI